MDEQYAGGPASDTAYPLPIGGIGGGLLDQMASERRHRRPTTREQIQERIAGLQAQVEKHQKVLAILDQNKGMEEALDALNGCNERGEVSDEQYDAILDKIQKRAFGQAAAQGKASGR